METICFERHQQRPSSMSCGGCSALSSNAEFEPLTTSAVFLTGEYEGHMVRVKAEFKRKREKLALFIHTPDMGWGSFLYTEFNSNLNKQQRNFGCCVQVWSLGFERVAKEIISTKFYWLNDTKAKLMSKVGAGAGKGMYRTCHRMTSLVSRLSDMKEEGETVCTKSVTDSG